MEFCKEMAVMQHAQEDSLNTTATAIQTQRQQLHQFETQYYSNAITNTNKTFKTNKAFYDNVTTTKLPLIPNTHPHTYTISERKLTIISSNPTNSRHMFNTLKPQMPKNYILERSTSTLLKALNHVPSCIQGCANSPP